MRLRIEKPIYGGAGLARHEGKAIFIPFTLPGEVVEAQITQDHGSYANAELVRVFEPSQHRVSPPCPHFGDCGGCHYQHADYQQQIEIKSQILRETLERAHLGAIPDILTLHANRFGYRNRIRLHIDPATSNLCYRKRASHDNLVVDACPIAAPVLEKALNSIQSAASVWELGKCFDEIELFTNPAQSSVLISFSASRNSKLAGDKLKQLCPQLQSLIQANVSVAAFFAEAGKLPGKFLASIGESSLDYATAHHKYRVSFGSFFQVNRFLIDALIDNVAGASSGSVAWDLYAGVGLFSAALAHHFDQLVAVEPAAPSVRDLRHNLHGHGYRIVASDTLEFLRRARSSKEKRPDLIVVDPPRAGLGKEVTTLLADIRPEHITYVSCDPATLSRDLKSLLNSGYNLCAIRMVDLFPQTFHLESVASLSLK